MSMGTRADFYVQRKGEDLEPSDWIGSVAFDGDPGGWGEDALSARTETDFRKMVASFANRTGHFTGPEMGWPWPWDDSRMTDYAYVWKEPRADTYNFGSRSRSEKAVKFPDMSDVRKVARGDRSGIMLIAAS